MFKKPVKKSWEELIADFKSGKLKFLKSRITIYQKKDTEYLPLNQKPKCTIHNPKEWDCTFKKVKHFNEVDETFLESWKIEHNFRIPVLKT